MSPVDRGGHRENNHQSSQQIYPHGRSGRCSEQQSLVGLAGCGSGSDDTTSSAAAAGGGSGKDVATGKTPVGTVLVDDAGRTLYAFAADTKGTSNCTGSCATYWPPVKAGAGTLTHTKDVTATLGTTKRPDGSTQLTVDGWPMYTYASDTKAGQATGQGLDLSGGKWWVVDSSGKWVKKSAPAEDTGGGGYGY